MVKATTSETEESDYYFERRIENIYENGSLLKRNIRRTEDNGYRTDERVSIDRLVYETTPLMQRSWPNDEEEFYYDSYEEGPSRPAVGD